ncbi:unnamed protein product, partial [marine sediment metagenome]
IVRFYDGNEAANRAQRHFERTIQDKEIPAIIPTLMVPSEITVKEIIPFLVKTNLVKSKSEARRILKEGGVYIDGTQLEENLDKIVKIPKEKGLVVKVGKRRFLRLQCY